MKKESFKLGSDAEYFAGNQWDLPSVLDIADAAERELEKRLTDAGIEEAVRDDLSLGFREALANAIVHGSGENTGKKIHVSLEISEKQIEVAIRDEGAGFDWEKELEYDPTSPEELERLQSHHRGIFMIRKFFDEVVFSDGGRMIRMVKHRKGHEAP